MEQLFNPLQTPTFPLLEQARQLHEQRFGRQVHLCTILNARSGACSEDCAFCSQSRHHRSEVDVYPLVEPERAVQEARQAEALGARCFSLVTSGRSPGGRKEREGILRAVEAIRNETRVEVAASLGVADPAFLRDLRSAGLSTYHHNLETSRSHFPYICTTHPFEDRVRTILDAHEAGLRVCAGGILGLGESSHQRAELARQIRDLPVERIPLNFLNPLPGTALEHRARLRPLQALHIVAAFRVAMPDREILVCGGREVTVKTLQPLLFLAGANGIMTGRYLTTAGQGVEADKRMIEDLQRVWTPVRAPNPSLAGDTPAITERAAP